MDGQKIQLLLKIGDLKYKKIKTGDSWGKNGKVLGFIYMVKSPRIGR